LQFVWADNLNSNPHDIRNSLRRFLVSVTCCLVVVASSFAAQGDVEGLEEDAIRKAVDSVAESVIRFETIGGTNRVEGAVVSNGPSTGVAVTNDGYVISASFHFAHEPASIFARLPDGKRASAEIVGRDLSRKLVLLKIQSDFEFSVPEAMDSEAVQVGETVIAVGRVLDAESPGISTGIVSATNRIWDRAIQTDAKISPANFGGPLLNLGGKVIGILVPMSPEDDGEMAGTEWYDSGIGFAVPFDNVLKQVEKLKQGKTLRKGLIGVSLKGTDMFADPAVVAFCGGASPAGKSGIKPGDEIVEINQQPIRRQSEMKHALGPLYEDDLANVIVIRDGRRLAFEVKLVGEVAPFIPPGIGILCGNEPEDQLVVVGVLDGGTAESAGIEVGDRITHFDGHLVESNNGLKQMIAATEVDSDLRLTLHRDGQIRQLTISIGRLGAEIPVGLPELERAQNARLITVKVAEVANECFALIPDSANVRADPSLLVWIPEAGKMKKETIDNTWREHCQSHNVVVLVPLSVDEQKWLPGESEFIVSAVDTLARRVKFDPKRVVVGGVKTGGAMASLVAFGQRDLFKGLVVVDSGLSQRARGILTSPVEPLMVLLGSNGPQSEQQKSSAEVLKRSHFPLAVEEKPIGTTIEHWVDDVLKWVRAVDRF